MRSVSAFFAFGMFLWNSCSVSKIKGHLEHAGFGLLRDPLFLGPACVLNIGISFLGFRRVSDSQGLRVSEFQSSTISESQGLRVPESQSLKVPEFHRLRVPQSQNSTISESASLRISQSQSFRI